MKIYSQDLDVKAIPHKTLIPYYISTKNKSLIYSEEGIFKIAKDKIYKMKVVDVPVKKYVMDNIVLYCDDSTIVVDDEWFQIPYSHYKNDIVEETYKLNSDSSMQMIFVKKDGFVQDIYFETKCDINTIGVKDDIISFLSLLKFNHTM